MDFPSRVRLRELGGLEDGFGSPSWASSGGGGGASPLLVCSSLLLSEAFLASALLRPRSAERRLSLCRRALLKNDTFSSAFPPRCCSLVEALGERRLVTEELLLELRMSLLSARPASPPLARGERAAGPPRRASTVGLVCIESLLKLRSPSFLRPPAELFSALPEPFLAVGEGESEDWGVERTHALCCGVASAG